MKTILVNLTANETRALLAQIKASQGIRWRSKLTQNQQQALSSARGKLQGIVDALDQEVGLYGQG